MERLSTKTKLLYGSGFASQGIKDGLFQVFLFYYYNQLLGLDPALTGISTLIALGFDAVSDPLVGIISDKWKSKNWGRRHPFMLASAIPLGITIWLLFVPPEGMGTMGLFWWLTIFTILVRLSLTLFQVPAMSLGAELSTDYEERTSITSYRIMFGALISTITIVIGFIVFFVPTEIYKNGLDNKEAYPNFALFCAILIVVFILLSTFGTKDRIPTLPQNTNESNRATFGQQLLSIATNFKMLSYRSLVIFMGVLYVAIGIGTLFTTYFIRYYFELTNTEMAVLPLASGVGGFLALAMAPQLGKRLDKKQAVILSTIIFALFFSLPYLLRLTGFFPSNGTSNLLPAYFLCVLLGYSFLWVSLSISNSMMAEVIDENELNTGEREEGVFFSSMSFAYKASVGLGYFFAGILLKIIAFPKQVNDADIPTSAIEGLGYIGGPVLFLVYASSVIFLLKYPITKERYQEIRNQLNKT